MAMYKLKYGLDTLVNCTKEMLDLGHNKKKYPTLIPYVNKFANNLNNIAS